MNEYEHTLKDFHSGLRTTSKLPIGTDTLVECYNARAGEHELEPYLPVVEVPIALPAEYVGIDVPWPFPQIVGCRDYAFVIYRNLDDEWDDIYLINPDWSLTHLANINFLHYGTITRRYEAIDFGTFVALTNGVCYFWYDTTVNLWRHGNYSHGTTLTGVPVPTSWCAYRGQIVAGGFVSTDVTDWWDGFGINAVGWSNIGEASFLYDLRNVAGHRPLPWPGQVRHVLPLHKGVVVYSTGGVGVLIPAREPVVTYQWEPLSDLGVLDDAYGSVAGGDLSSHLFITKDGKLNQITADFKIKTLDYWEFISELSHPVINKDPNGDFYISDAETCYLLTDYGMSTCHQRVKSIAEISKVVYATLDDNLDHEFRVKHHEIDFEMRGQKTIFTLEHGLTAKACYSDVEWKTDKVRDFKSSGWKLINSQGISVNKIAGTEFRLALRALSYEDVKHSYVKIRWKMTDMRSIRGVYVPR